MTPIERAIDLGFWPRLMGYLSAARNPDPSRIVELAAEPVTGVTLTIAEATQLMSTGQQSRTAASAYVGSGAGSGGRIIYRDSRGRFVAGPGNAGQMLVEWLGESSEHQEEIDREVARQLLIPRVNLPASAAIDGGEPEVHEVGLIINVRKGVSLPVQFSTDVMRTPFQNIVEQLLEYISVFCGDQTIGFNQNKADCQDVQDVLDNWLGGNQRSILPDYIVERLPVLR